MHTRYSYSFKHHPCRTSPRGVNGVFCSFVDLWESPPSIWFRVTKKPGCTGLVINSWVRDWLWLGKVLATLAHPTWGKLLCGLMQFKRFWKLSCQWFLKNKRKVLIGKEILIFSGKENLITLTSIKTKQAFLFNIKNTSYV